MSAGGGGFFEWGGVEAAHFEIAIALKAKAACVQVFDLLEPFGIIGVGVFEFLLGCVVFVKQRSCIGISDVISMREGFFVFREGMVVGAVPEKSLQSEETEEAQCHCCGKYEDDDEYPIFQGGLLCDGDVAENLGVHAGYVAELAGGDLQKRFYACTGWGFKS